MIILLPLNSQYPVYRFENLNTDDGLSNNIIHSIIQDKNGFLWIGTQDGLNRYDGYKFKVYKNDPDDSLSISFNRAGRIFEDNQGYIWILGKNTGVNKFDPKTEAFKLYENIPGDSSSLPHNDIVFIGEGDNGQLFFRDVNEIVFTFDREQEMFPWAPEFKFPVTPLVTKLTLDIIEGELNEKVEVAKSLIDKKGNIWLGVKKYGLIRVNTDSSVTNFSRSGLHNIVVNTIYEDRTGVIWIGTIGHGLFKYNPSNELFTLLNHFENNHTLIDKFTVRAISKDTSGIIWVGTYTKGLIRLNRETGDFQSFVHEEERAGSILNDNVRAIFVSSSGEVWVGTYKGLSRYNSKMNGFDNYSLIDEDAEPGNRRHYRVYNIAEDEEGNLWIANWESLVKFDPRKKTFKSFSKFLLGMDNIRKVYFDKNKNLWVGAEFGGIAVMDIHSEKILDISKEYNQKLSNNNVFDIYQDSDGIMWVSTFNGLNKLDMETGDITHYTVQDGLHSNMVFSLMEGDNKDLWLTTSNGLSRMDLSDNSIATFTSKHGLQNNEFSEGGYSIDKELNEIIIGGVGGINIFNPDSITKDTFPPQVAITGLEILNQEIRPGRAFNNRIILEESIDFTNEIRLSYKKDKVFTLHFSALHFKAQDKNQYAYKLDGFDKEFIYTDASVRSATYTNLDPGTYEFKVMASNNDGVWNEEYKSVKIIIVPTFLQTSMFRFLVLFVLIGSIIVFYLIRIRFIEKQKEELELKVLKRTDQLRRANSELEEKKEEVEVQKEMLLHQNKQLEEHKHNLEDKVKKRTLQLEKAKVKAEESDRLKTSFLENMSHEIRTPMNAIIGFSNLLDDNDLTKEERGEFVKLINRNSNSLLSIIEDIFDLSKIQSGIISIEPTEFYLNDLLEDVYLVYKDNPKFMKDTVRFIYVPLEKDYLMRTDYHRSKQVITNLLTNAFKYTHEGMVELYAEIESEKKANIYVRDTGIGISRKNQKIIFKRFSKVEEDKTVLYSGVGLGLSISKQLSKFLGGNIKVHSEMGLGSTFVFTFPGVIGEAKYSEKKDVEEKNKSGSPVWKNVSLLIVEDEDDSYFYLERILRGSGLTLIRAADGVEAVESFASNKQIELVLMDIKLPKMDGYQVLKHIKSMNKEIPVVAQTAFALSGDLKKMWQAGFDEILPKPISKNDLINVINDLFQTRNEPVD